VSANRTARERIARDTLRVIDDGGYVAPNGARVDLSAPLARCLERTRHLEADAVGRVIEMQRDVAGTHATRIDVVNETTLAGLAALLAQDDAPVAVLNFASAKHPGGGFLGGSQAQEESLARSSALYASLSRCEAFYERHRASSSLLYSDAVIVSPDCPVFRDDDGALLDVPQMAGFLTCAAPNAGAIAQNRPDELPHIASTFHHRIEGVLAVAAEAGYRRLVLGAWGCGVFRNDPAMVAGAFAEHLLHGAWRGRFEAIRFSVLDGSRDLAIFESFRRAFTRSV
jgi:uncharacterized protein (TIGR02452 family)